MSTRQPGGRLHAPVIQEVRASIPVGWHPPNCGRLVSSRNFSLLSHKTPRMAYHEALCAEVAKRQTQWTQNPPWATTWGFKSPPRHHWTDACRVRFAGFPPLKRDHGWLMRRTACAVITSLAPKKLEVAVAA